MLSITAVAGGFGNRLEGRADPVARAARRASTSPSPLCVRAERLRMRMPKGPTSAGNWAGSGRHGPSPSCFGPKGVGPRRPKKISGRAVPAQRVKIEAQPGPKARRAFFGPCRPKHGPHITKINNKTYEDTQISTIRNSHNSKYLNMKHT